MKKPMLNHICLWAIATGILFAMACKKNDFTTTETIEDTPAFLKKMSSFNSALAFGEALLNVNYETGTQTSGITGVDSTNVNPVGDASYLVSPGATGNYAIAHKIIGGDPAYQSDGNTRSEADAIAYLPARFAPGDVRRYEVSILLKDWAEYDGTEPAYETNIFQLKMSNSLPIPLMIRVKRNSLQLRYGNIDATNTEVNAFDYRPYINQWMHFRIEASFTMDATGYVKVYGKLPGQSDYTLLDQKLNRRTFTGDPAAGNIGYIKWGAYIAAPGVTRIVYHDDIKIINLNPTAPAQIWKNAIDGTQPFTSPITSGNLTDSNVSNSGSTSPSFFYGGNTLSPYGTFSGRVLLQGWTNKAGGAGATPLNPNQYYEFKVQPLSGHSIGFYSLNFVARRGNIDDVGKYVMRSSLDNFATDISPVQSFSAAANTPTSVSYDLSPLPNVTSPITLRLYWFGTNRTSGNNLLGIEDFQFLGQVL